MTHSTTKCTCSTNLWWFYDYFPFGTSHWFWR